MSSSVCFVAGSSPRIRGKSLVVTVPCSQIRIIPANTGRILPRKRMAAREWDHPREYGENMFQVFIGLVNWGSSPRIRGELIAGCW